MLCMQPCAMDVDTSIPLPSIQNDPSTSSLSTQRNGSAQTLSQKLRIIRYSQENTTTSSCNKHFLYESFPLTQELMRSRKNSLRIDMFRRNYSRNISTPENVLAENGLQEESIQTECSFFDRCDEATQTESPSEKVGSCFCSIS